MKVINSLIAVEVPRDAKDPQLTNGNGLMVFFDTKPIGTATRYQLPFPAEIIGLASGIKELQTDDFINTTTIVFNAAGRDYQSWADLYNDLGVLPTPTTDIIFLRKKL